MNKNYNWLKFKAHERVHDIKSRTFKEIKKGAVKVGNENDQLDDQLNESNVILHQRKHVNDEMSKIDFDF